MDRRLVITILLFLVGGLLVIGFKQGLSQRGGIGTKGALRHLEDELKKVKVEQTSIKAKLLNLERAVRSKKSSPTGLSSSINDLPDSFVTEVVSRDNVDSKAVWNQTNRPDVFLVSVRLEREPNPNTLLVWTGLGVLPFNAYRVDGKTLSILFEQPREAFIASNNFINIRYSSRARK